MLNVPSLLLAFGLPERVARQHPVVVGRARREPCSVALTLCAPNAAAEIRSRAPPARPCSPTVRSRSQPCRTGSSSACPAPFGSTCAETLHFARRHVLRREVFDRPASRRRFGREHIDLVLAGIHHEHIAGLRVDRDAHARLEHRRRPKRLHQRATSSRTPRPSVRCRHTHRPCAALPERRACAAGLIDRDRVVSCRSSSPISGSTGPSSSAAFELRRHHRARMHTFRRFLSSAFSRSRTAGTFFFPGQQFMIDIEVFAGRVNPEPRFRARERRAQHRFDQLLRRCVGEPFDHPVLLLLRDRPTRVPCRSTRHHPAPLLLRPATFPSAFPRPPRTAAHRAFADASRPHTPCPRRPASYRPRSAPLP